MPADFIRSWWVELHWPRGPFVFAPGRHGLMPYARVLDGIALYVVIEPPSGGLTPRSFAKPEDVRSLSTERLVRRTGTVSAATLDEVRDRLRVVLGL